MSKPSIKMLSIDDRSLTTDLDRAGYRKKGIQVHTSKTFGEAQEALEKHSIDIVVVNADHEGLNAEGVIQHLTSNSASAEIPVVATSVQGKASLQKKLLKAGASLFIEQPIPREKFIEAIKSLLQQDSRGTKRLDVLGQVKFTVDGKEYHADIGDLSTSGILIATDENIADGAEVDLHFKLSGERKKFRITGEAVRTIGPKEAGADGISGVGVRFVTFDGDDQARLRTYFQKHQELDSDLRYYL